MKFIKTLKKHYCGLFFLIMFFAVSSAQTNRPNVILILGDDIGYEVPTCDGGKSYETPNIDSLAANGMRFTQCHAPLCCPSRFMLLTGKYNFRNYTEWGHMETAQKTLGNMFRDAGYKTAVYAKWQMGGGDYSIHTLGFDRYSVWDPFDPDSKDSRYKNPHIYQGGNFLPDSSTYGKYGDDIFTDSVLNFIDSNKNNPFFIYFPICLAHVPQSPTPDDSDFSWWDPKVNDGDTLYFKSMIKYMDKKVGLVADKIKSLGIEDNTIIIYTADNGTNDEIFSRFEDTIVQGGKTLPTEAGTHVPLIVCWKGKIAAASVNNDLIDFPDFMPTLAELAAIPKPVTYGILDGTSFAPQMLGETGNPDDWIFCHYDHHPGKSELIRMVQNKTYKLYDTSRSYRSYRFYNIVSDILEEHPLPDSILTHAEALIKKQFLRVLDTIEKGLPVAETPQITNIDFFSADLRASVAGNSFPVTRRGIVFDTLPQPSLVDTAVLKGAGNGSFKLKIKGLTANKTYYARTFATNDAGTSYSEQICFTTLALPGVNAIAATNIRCDGFTANWDANSLAKKYLLDVSEKSSFCDTVSSAVSQGFDSGINVSQGWMLSNGISTYTDAGKYGNTSPSLKLKASNQKITTPVFIGKITSLSFWIKGIGTDVASCLLVQGFNGIYWQTIDSITNLPLIATIKKYDQNTSIFLLNSFSQLRFTYTQSAGYLALDDINIQTQNIIPSFVAGYNSVPVFTNSKKVLNLLPSKNYFYRLRAINGNSISDYSNVIAVTTKTCEPYFSENIYTQKTKSSFNIKAYPNPAANIFMLSVSSTKNYFTQIIVLNTNGKIVYQTNIASNKTISFGKGLPAGMYIIKAMQGSVTKTIKLVKTQN